MEIILIVCLLPEVKDEDIEECASIYADTIVLKKASVDCAHIEVGVTRLYCTIIGCNGFSHLSAPGVGDENIEEEFEVSASDPSVFWSKVFQLCLSA